MQAARMTVGETAALVPVSGQSQFIELGMRLLAREDNSGDVYLGTTSAVTTANGVLIPKGDPATSFPFVVPAEHFKGSPGTVYLIASAATQYVDWSIE